MTVITFPRTRQRGAPRTLTLLVVSGLLFALAAGLVAGAMRVLPSNPLPATLVAPVVTDDSPWPTEIEGLTMVGGMDHGPGGLVITDLAGDGVMVVDGSGGLVMALGTSGRLPGQLEFQRDPMDPGSAYGGAAWLPDGSIAVADSGNHRVQILRRAPTAPDGSNDPDDWEAVEQIGGYGIEDGRFLSPFDVTASGSELLVVDDQRDDISRFDHDGTFLGRIGEHGEADGQMHFTGGIATDTQGNLFNADFGNGRVQSWDAARRFRWSVPIPDGGDPAHGQPLDLDVDEGGFIWVTTNDGRLLTLAPDGRIVGGWDALAQPGADVPLMAAAADDGVVFVGEMLTGRIHRLETAQQEVEPLPVPVATPGPTASLGRGPSSPALLRPTGSFPVPFSVTAPDGWSIRAEDAGEVEAVMTTDSGIPARFIASIPFEVYADPCHPDQGVVPTGTTVRDLASAIANGQGMERGSLEETTIDGHPAVVVELFNRMDPRGCSDPSASVRQWRNIAFDGGPGFAQRTGSGARQRMAVVDVDGTRVVFWTETFGGPMKAVREAQEVFDSLRIP